ncbi:MAG: lipopolysaccharide heptosyltransferase I [Burkholderiales bacterium]
MNRILLVKTSSLGDVVHNLPVASDIAVNLPQAEIDWVVEEPFAPIPQLHGMVKRVIPVALRRWRKDLYSMRTWREIAAFRRRLSANRYDAIVDTQGLLKSALVVSCARGRKYGLDWHSSREPLAAFYHETFRIPWGQHAVERNRKLAASALGYTLSSPANFAARVPEEWQSRLATRLPGHIADATEGRYAILLHGTSARQKEWPQENWAALGRELHSRGMVSLLPFGSAAEQTRSENLADAIPAALVPPRLELDSLSALLSRATLVVGVDTGLTHLAAALGRPTVGIYCATDPHATGLYGSNRAINVGSQGKRGRVEEVLIATDKALAA